MGTSSHGEWSSEEAERILTFAASQASAASIVMFEQSIYRMPPPQIVPGNQKASGSMRGEQ